MKMHIFQDPVIQAVGTLAGTGTSGYQNGPTTSALFNSPNGIAVDPLNGNVIVADTVNYVIRLINITSNSVSTLAGVNGNIGYQDGPTTSALFNSPNGVAVDPFNGNVIVADSGNYIIRLINITSNIVSTLAGTGTSGYQDGLTTSALFNSPNGIVVDPSNGNFIVADSANNVIRLINITSNNVSTLAGTGIRKAGFLDGPMTSALFYLPAGVAINPLNGNVIISDSGNNAIRYSGSISELSNFFKHKIFCSFFFFCLEIIFQKK